MFLFFFYIIIINNDKTYVISRMINGYMVYGMYIVCHVSLDEIKPPTWANTWVDMVR